MPWSWWPSHFGATNICCSYSSSSAVLSCVSIPRPSYSSSTQTSLTASVTVLYTATTTQLSLQLHRVPVLLFMSWGNLSQWYSTCFYSSLWPPGFPADRSLLLTVPFLYCSALNLSKAEIAIIMVFWCLLVVVKMRPGSSQDPYMQKWKALTSPGQVLALISGLVRVAAPSLGGLSDCFPERNSQQAFLPASQLQSAVYLEGQKEPINWLYEKRQKPKTLYSLPETKILGG